MTIWYVTTGISLWESSRCWKLQGRDDKTLEPADRLSERDLSAQDGGPLLLAQWAAARENIMTEINGTNSSSVADRANGIVESSFREKCWSEDRLKALPAEMATLWGLFDHNTISNGDQIRLIQGKSNETVAPMLRAMLAKAVPDFANRIEIIGPYALDPLKPKQFNDDVDAMWKAIPSSNGSDWAFVLTGGYKALLIAIARRAPAGTPLYYSHESDPSKVILLTAGEQGEVTANPFLPSS